VATATAIVEAAHLPGVELDARWREADVGMAEGRTFDELSAIAPDVAAALARGDLEIDWPGGETHSSLAARVADAWADLVAVGRPAVVVTHAGPFMHARALGEDRPISRDDLVEPAATGRVLVSEGSARDAVLRSSA
jgi:broad specificity phosphatase PhoE